MKKLRCVGHVQKRMGTKLHKLRTEYKGKELSDKKKIGGKGRLTDKVINTIQNYCRMAIRQNKSQLYAIKKSVCAILYHCSANEDNEDRHKYCPRSAESWCKYQADKITGSYAFISLEPDIIMKHGWLYFKAGKGYQPCMCISFE